jgi:glycosyltransferase involved in cell wall biosynthesis
MKRGDGLSPFIWELCLHLSRLNWDVTVLVPHHKGLKDSETWDGIKIERFHYLPEGLEDVGYSGGIMPNLKKAPWNAFKLPFYIFAMYREALRLAIDGKFDIVNFHWLFPSAFWLRQFVRSSGLPVVVTGHGTDIHLATKGLFRIIANRALPVAEAITVNSNYMKNLLRDNRLPSGSAVIYMGADTEKFRRGAGKASNSKTILYVGRLIKQKGIDLLIDSFIDILKIMPDARLEIVGYGAEKDNIEKKVISTGIETSIIMTDIVSHDKLPDVYCRARVIALPSLIPEGLGLTVAEAGLCGVPCVTFGLGGTAEIVVDEKTGLIVEPTRQALTRGLLKILSDDNLADKLGGNARNHLIKLIGWPQIADKFNRLYTEILESARHKQASKFSRFSAGLVAVILIIVTCGYFIKTFIDRFERIMGLFK